VFDPSQSPHATADQLSEWLGVKKTTMAKQGPVDPRHPTMSHLDDQFVRRDLVESSPLTWLLEVDGALVDIRRAPLHLQVQAFELVLTAYVAGIRDGSA
jgi:hypothetical protein